MIYPIIEENETSDQGKRMEENRRDRSLLEGKSFLKPGSGGSSFYQTVLDGNDGVSLRLLFSIVSYFTFPIFQVPTHGKIEYIV